eukprot:COSAG06_NODE_6597_length_2861_cov_1.888849_4_plen_162_part_00
MPLLTFAQQHYFQAQAVHVNPLAARRSTLSPGNERHGRLSRRRLHGKPPRARPAPAWPPRAPLPITQTSAPRERAWLNKHLAPDVPARLRLQRGLEKVSHQIHNTESDDRSTPTKACLRLAPCCGLALGWIYRASHRIAPAVRRRLQLAPPRSGCALLGSG